MGTSILDTSVPRSFSLFKIFVKLSVTFYVSLYWQKSESCCGLHSRSTEQTVQSPNEFSFSAFPRRMIHAVSDNSRQCYMCTKKHSMLYCCCGAESELVYLKGLARATCSFGYCEDRFINLQDIGQTSDAACAAFQHKLSALSVSDGTDAKADATREAFSFASVVTSDAFMGAVWQRRKALQASCTCPGLRGHSYEPLYCCGAQGVLHTSDITNACRGDPGFAPCMQTLKV